MTWFVLLLPGALSAHPLAPALLDIRELGGGQCAIVWKTSAFRVPGAEVKPVLPPSCRMVSPAETVENDGGVTTRFAVACGDRGLVGERLGVEGLAAGKINALVRVRLADGRLVQQVLGATAPSFVVPARPTWRDVVVGYGRLGVEHILTGPDHLLFVFGLLLLCPAMRALVATITAFTVGHSVTLSFAILDMVRVPAGPTEVLIALSVFVLAVELARESPGPTLMRRFPWAVAGSFGLLHGLGFAGALREVGLPGADIPMALFSFNLGIEIGQLFVVVLVLAGRRALARVAAPLPRWLGWMPVYVMGSLAAYWCLERSAALVH